MSAIGLPHASSASSLPQNVPSDSTSPRVPTALTRQPSTSLCAPSLTSLSLPTPPAITSAAPQAVLGKVNWSVHSASVDVALTCNLLRFQLDKFKEKKLRTRSSPPCLSSSQLAFSTPATRTSSLPLASSPLTMPSTSRGECQEPDSRMCLGLSGRHSR